MLVIVTDVPVELRPDAVQCVLLLLPDEHREALETLLDFLNHVASNAPYNQMTASNLAVGLAPSLFHFNHSNTNVTNRSSSVSPRRRKTVGIPDQRELSENKAAHDCLLYLVKMHRELFMVSGSMPNVQVVREERHPSSSRNGDCDRARIREIYTRMIRACTCVYSDTFSQGIAREIRVNRILVSLFLVTSGLLGYADAVSFQLHGRKRAGRIGGAGIRIEAGLARISLRLHHGLVEGSA